MVAATRKEPLVSLIIPTYNEEKRIAKCLQSLVTQTYPNLEIIVVNSLRTKDQTSKVARKFTDKIFEYGQERSEQRNYGAKKAKGEFIVFIDADMELDKTVTADCVLNIQKSKEIQGIIIPEVSFGENYWAECKALERNCYIGDETIEAARFFRKSAFAKVDGYHPEMISGEDWDLHQRIKKEVGSISRVNSLIHHNEGKITLWKDIKKKFYYSQKADQYLATHKKSFKEVFLFIFRPAYFRNWKMLLADPIHLPGFILMKSLEVIVGGFGAILLKKSFWSGFFKTS